MLFTLYSELNFYQNFCLLEYRQCRQCWKTWQDLRMNMKNTGLMGICGQTLELIDAFGISFQLYHVRGALGALVVPVG